MKRNKQIRCAVLTLLILSSPFARAAWTYDCTQKDGDVSVTGRIFTLPASATTTLWVSNATVDNKRLSRIFDSQSRSSAATDDIIKNLVNTSFTRLFI